MSPARFARTDPLAFALPCGYQIPMSNENAPRPVGARRALILLLAINLFNYIDRYILAAVEPEIQRTFLPNDPSAMAKAGSLATAFLVTYMLTAPVFGWVADHIRRWWIIGASVALWSLASAGSGLATAFNLLFFTRCLVGVGEAGYGPSAPTIISDLFPIASRGRMMSYFYMAIPVGSAIGYGFGGAASSYFHSWRAPFYLVAVPGLILAGLCFLMPEPKRGEANGESAAKSGKGTNAAKGASFRDYVQLAKNKSFTLNTLAMTAMTFAIGGISFWVPSYISVFRHQPDLGRINIIFGAITVVAGLIATLLGGIIGDRVRQRFPGAYFQVSGIAMLIAFPFVIAFLYVPFPYAWGCLFCAIFFLFFNTGPSNTALANATHPSVRAMAFAVNILVIHAAGDAFSPTLIGAIADRSNMNVAFLVVSAAILLASGLWLFGAKYLQEDEERAKA